MTYVAFADVFADYSCRCCAEIIDLVHRNSFHGIDYVHIFRARFVMYRI